MPQCEWITDGWPHRQCSKIGTEIVYLPTGTFPTVRMCKRHAARTKMQMAMQSRLPERDH
jgi:hypothetical protein